MTTATATCYRQNHGFIQTESGWVICPKKYEGLCCEVGSECLDEQICHNPKNAVPGGSGYYIGLCTVLRTLLPTVWKARANFTSQDATYKAPSCSSRCTDDYWGDVTYNSSTNLWACCGTNEACDNPTNETFLASPPQQLLAAASSQSATTAASTSISTSISSATMTVTSTPLAIVSQTSSLNDGAKAGIGVVAALAALAIIALLAWVILLRKRLRSHGQARYVAGKGDSDMMNQGLPKEAQRDAVHEHELSGYSRSHEMEGR